MVKNINSLKIQEKVKKWKKSYAINGKNFEIFFENVKEIFEYNKDTNKKNTKFKTPWFIHVFKIAKDKCLQDLDSDENFYEFKSIRDFLEKELPK